MASIGRQRQPELYECKAAWALQFCRHPSEPNPETHEQLVEGLTLLSPPDRLSFVTAFLPHKVLGSSVSKYRQQLQLFILFTFFRSGFFFPKFLKSRSSLYSLQNIKFKRDWRAGSVTVRALLSLVPSAHSGQFMPTCNPAPGDLMPSLASGHLLHTIVAYTVPYTHIHKAKSFLNE